MNKLIFMPAILSVALSFQPAAQAAKMNCDKFSKELKALSSTIQKKQKDLATLDTQIQSSTKVINDYNKNCRAASNPSCNPALYAMLSGQIPNLNGHRQKLSDELMETAAKQEDATKNLRLCKAVKFHKNSLTKIQ